MDKRVLKTIGIIAAVTLVFAPSIHAQRISPEEFRWSGTLADGEAIEIKGVNGDVLAEGYTGSAVEVVAILRGRRDDPAEVDFEVLEHSDGVTICAMYPSWGRRANRCDTGSRGRMNVEDFDVDVEFRVRVPAGVTFVGRTVNGDVEVRDVRANAYAHTVNGDIDVAASGTVEAHTVNGSIDAEMGTTTWEGELDFHTVNGSIRLRVPRGLSAEITGSTVNGGFESDFPLTIQGRFGPRRIRGEIGEGGPGRMRFETVNGSIRILER